MNQQTAPYAGIQKVLSGYKTSQTAKAAGNKFLKKSSYLQVRNEEDDILFIRLPGEKWKKPSKA